MPGNGKYSIYAVDRSVKSLLFERLFPGKKNISSPYAGLTQAEAIIVANEAGQEYLRGGETGIQNGDPLTVGSVSLAYSGAPDTTKVRWGSPGDPINGYVSDITSPGPGKTGGVDKNHVKDDLDELRKIPERLKPSYTPTEDTRSPSETSGKIHGNNSLKNSKMTYAKSGA